MNVGPLVRSSSRCADSGSPVLPQRTQGQDESSIRVLLADDHPIVREGLVAILGSGLGLRVVASAADGEEAVELWKQHRPDVTVLDLRMPRLDGIGALQRIRQQSASARVIVMTTFDSDEDVYQAMREGAKGYLLKDAPPEELLACIQRVHEGGGCIPPAIAAKLAEHISGDELTRRELEVLALLARGRGNKEIGQALYISDTTVKSHVKSLFAKLRVRNRTQALAAATRRGLIRL